MTREAIIPEVRTKMLEAESQMRDAANLLRTNGFPESASDIVQMINHSRTWTQPSGVLDWLSKPDPEGVNQ